MRVRSHTLIPSLNPGKTLGKVAGICLSVVAAFSSTAFANSEDQAKKIHNRLTGVDPTTEVRQAMAAKIAEGDAVGAALMAVEHEGFYDITLKNWAKPWSNEAGTVKFPLNDFVATVVGMVRDDKDFREVLSGDIIYTSDLQGLPAYSMDNNEHYVELESRLNQADVSLKTAIQEQTQSALYGDALPATATAGVLTTRQGAAAYLIAGTNRAMFAFTMENFLCKDMESLGDAGGASSRIRQDVERNPGLDSAFFANYCVKCHSQMDPNNGAFAYYTFVEGEEEGTGRMEYTEGQVHPKYLVNADAYPEGFVTKDDSWINSMRSGINMTMGWDEALPGSGVGAKSWGQEVSHSRDFAVCQAKKAYEATCLTEPKDVTAEKIADVFVESGYNMKRVFAETAVQCMGN